MVDAKMVRDIATKYIYDRCPAVVGVGKKILLFYKFSQILWETDMKVSLSKSNFIIPQALHSGALSLNLQEKKTQYLIPFFVLFFFFVLLFHNFFYLNLHIKIYRFSGFLPLFCFSFSIV